MLSFKVLNRTSKFSRLQKVMMKLLYDVFFLMMKYSVLTLSFPLLIHIRFSFNIQYSSSSNGMPNENHAFFRDMT